MRNPFKRKPPAFTGNCMIRQYTADGDYVGNCYYSTYDGVCPHHGDVSEWLGFVTAYAGWPRDFELPKYDGNPWAEELRCTVTDARPEGDCPRGTPGCKYSDCSGMPGKACYGPAAPQHMDMGI